MKTVILGGSGFLGQHLASRFSDDGHEVTTVSRSPRRSVSPQHQHRDITLDDRQALSELLAETDFLFHVASDTTPGSSRLQPGLEVVNNLLPLSGLLDNLQRVNKPLLVYVSSGGAVYDTGNGDGALAETGPTGPMSYYGAGKLAAEAFIQAYHHQSGHPALVIRPANIYGPGQIPKKQFGIVPTLCNCLMDNKPFTLWGDGSAVRDYLYIEDFLTLCSAIVDRNWQADSLEILNAGTGSGHSILELCRTLERVSGKSLTIDQQAPRGVDVPDIVLDCARAKDLLGWSAQTKLETGLTETWQWFCQQA
jgi:UDP-glucose 4-epimerase